MINGIINVYKEKEFTSFDVVAVMRGIAGQKKVGHTGTLDPMAEGVLPICLGNATKLCDMLTDKRKEYVASFLLGQKSDTLDVWGEILETKEVKTTEDELKNSIMSFVGGYDQYPPMYSAKKVNGKKLYELAREGKVIERKASFVEIYDIEIIDISLPTFTIKVSCGKGTYIRSLGEDIAAKCGEICIMTSLLRTRVSEFVSDEAYTLGELKELKEKGELTSVVKPTETAFYEYKVCHVDSKFRKLIDNGNKMKPYQLIEKITFTDQEFVRVKNDDDIFVGLFKFNQETEELVPVKMFMGE